MNKRLTTEELDLIIWSIPESDLMEFGRKLGRKAAESTVLSAVQKEECRALLAAVGIEMPEVRHA